MNSTAPDRSWWTFGPHQTRIVTLPNGRRLAAPYLLRTLTAQEKAPKEGG